MKWWTPLEIEVLLHFHVSPEAHPRADAPGVAQAIRRFVNEDILALEHPKVLNDRYRTTERGRRLVAMLCETPLPVKQTTWADPRYL